MTPMFDELDQELREALALEALPSAGFTDRVMARVAQTPQQKKTPAPYRKWLVSAAACLAVAAALVPLVRSGGLTGAGSAGNDTVAGSAGLEPSMQSMPAASADDNGAAGDNTQQKLREDAGDQDNAGGNLTLSDPLSMEDALTSAAEALREQGWDLTVVDRQDNAVQVTLTAADGASGDQALLDETMESAGFTAAGDWYIFENSKEETDLHTRQLTCAAIVGAAYAVLSIFGSIFGITYGPIQCRFSEALCVLPFLLPETAWGLGVGCLIANLLSPYGVLDIVVGSAATLLAALLTARCKKKWLAPLPPVLANMVLVGLVLAYEQAGTTAAFWPTYAFNALTVGAGEIVACYGLGMLLLWRLEKSKALQNYLQNR